MGEIHHLPVRHLEVDGDRRSAQPGMGGGAGIGIRQSPEPRNVGGQGEDTGIVDVVNHRLIRGKHAARITQSG